MIGNVAPPSHVDEIDSQLPAPRFVSENVRAGRRRAEGDHVWVLEEQQLIRYVAGSPAPNQVRL